MARTCPVGVPILHHQMGCFRGSFWYRPRIVPTCVAQGPRPSRLVLPRINGSLVGPWIVSLAVWREQSTSSFGVMIRSAKV